MGNCIRKETSQLYVGTHLDFSKWIKPVKQILLNDEFATIGTRNKILAILCISHCSSEDFKIEWDSKKRHLHLTECRPGSFTKLKDENGYIYEVSKRHFKHDLRLPLDKLLLAAPRNFRIKIHNKTRILSIWDSIQGFGIIFHCYTDQPSPTPII